MLKDIKGDTNIIKKEKEDKAKNQMEHLQKKIELKKSLGKIKSK